MPRRAPWPTPAGGTRNRRARRATPRTSTPWRRAKAKGSTPIGAGARCCAGALTGRWRRGGGRTGGRLPGAGPAGDRCRSGSGMAGVVAAGGPGCIGRGWHGGDARERLDLPDRLQRPGSPDPCSGSSAAPGCTCSASVWIVPSVIAQDLRLQEDQEVGFRFLVLRVRTVLRNRDPAEQRHRVLLVGGESWIRPPSTSVPPSPISTLVEIVRLLVIRLPASPAHCSRCSNSPHQFSAAPHCPG